MIRMFFFQLAMVLRTPYFVELLITSTLSIFALQWLGDPTNPEVVLRAGLVGMWTMSTVSAGLIGFQRHLGTLVPLLMGPRAPGWPLAALVFSAATFGLLAFPLAAALGLIAGTPFPHLDIPGIAAYWLACCALCSVIAPLFVLTPNAATYEPLLGAPIVLASGIFGYAALTGTWSRIFPTRWAVAMLQGEPSSLIGAVAVSAAWLACGALLARLCLRKATVDATLEVL